MKKTLITLLAFSSVFFIDSHAAANMNTLNNSFLTNSSAACPPSPMPDENNFCQGFREATECECAKRQRNCDSMSTIYRQMIGTTAGSLEKACKLYDSGDPVTCFYQWKDYGNIQNQQWDDQTVPALIYRRDSNCENFGS